MYHRGAELSAAVAAASVRALSLLLLFIDLFVCFDTRWVWLGAGDRGGTVWLGSIIRIFREKFSIQSKRGGGVSGQSLTFPPFRLVIQFSWCGWSSAAATATATAGTRLLLFLRVVDAPVGQRGEAEVSIPVDRTDVHLADKNKFQDQYRKLATFDVYVSFWAAWMDTVDR